MELKQTLMSNKQNLLSREQDEKQPDTVNSWRVSYYLHRAHLPNYNKVVEQLSAPGKTSAPACSGYPPKQEPQSSFHTLLIFKKPS